MARTRKIFFFNFLVVVLCLTIIDTAYPENSITGSLVKVKYGITKADLSGQGLNAMIVLARRENFNAHGFDVLTMYIEDSSVDRFSWHIIPVFRDEKEELEITIGGGADCLLHDFRLLRNTQSHSTQLIIARREMGESYIDEKNVMFEYYELKKNTEKEVGSPLYYFVKIGSIKSKKKYCDVGDAFKKELGLGGYR
jgi:hypothetical protein